jgi:hypothetical protein
MPIVEDGIQACRLGRVELQSIGERWTATFRATDAIAEINAIGRESQGAADHDGAEEEGDGEILGLLHNDAHS